MLNCNYHNASLRFDTPEFQACLCWCLQIGKKLSGLEPAPNQGILLFEMSGGMENLTYIVSLRMTETDPVLIRTSSSICMILADTKVQPPCGEICAHLA